MNDALPYWMVAAAAGDDVAMALAVRFMPASGSSEAVPIKQRAAEMRELHDVHSPGAA